VEIILAGKVIYKVEKDGQYFGEVSALKKLPRDHTARTVVDSIIVELSLDQYLKVLRNSPSLSMELIGRLGDLLASQDKDQMASKSSSSAKA
jgi:CRP-like cAMP-binding protein